jgi:hypothetical protein
MVLLPILAREARRAKTSGHLSFPARCCLFAVFMGIYLLIEAKQWTASAAIGREIFQILVWIAFAFCLFSGVMFASGLLCQERRDGSLALLFLARLTGLDVILGKLAAILQELLGPRFADYQRAQDPVFRNLLTITARFDLPVTVAMEVYSLKAQPGASERAMQLLGEHAFQNYVQRGWADWLK